MERAWVVVSILVSGCLAAPAAERGHPLYSAGSAPLPVEKVARLRASMPGGTAPGAGASSFIRSVDGREVGVDAVFELLPGCHLVETARSLVVSNQNLSFTATLPALVFPFRMVAGHEYEVVVRFDEPTSMSGRLGVFGISRNPASGRSWDVPAAKSDADLEACRAWKPPGA